MAGVYAVFFANALQAAGYYNNYQYLPGDRAAGMGGAFTAAADDSSSLWYNPAGLALIDSTDVSMSGNAYNYLQTETRGYVEFEKSDGTYDEINLNEKDISAVATTMLFANKIGNAGGFAFGILVPYQDSLNGVMKGETTGADSSTYMETQFQDNSQYLVGMAGWGKSFFKKLNLGLALSLGYYKGNSEESEYFLDQWNSGADSSNETFRENYEFTDYLMGAVFGVQFSVTEHNILGLKISTPSFSLYGTTEINSLYLVSGTRDVDKEESSESIKNDAFERILPEKYSVGYTYNLPEKFTMSIDVELIGTTDEATNYVVNCKAGAEYFITENIALRAGFFTDLSQQNDVDTDPDSDNSEKMNYYGATLSFSFGADLNIGNSEESGKEQKSWTTFGLMYRFGSGDIRNDSYDDNLELTHFIKEKKVNNVSLFIGESISF